MQNARNVRPVGKGNTLYLTLHVTERTNQNNIKLYNLLLKDNGEMIIYLREGQRLIV